MGVINNTALARALAEVTDAASTEHGADPLPLDGYLPALGGVATTGRRLDVEEKKSCRRLLLSGLLGVAILRTTARSGISSTGQVEEIARG